MEPILKVNDLTKVFTRAGQPDFTAVNHISFELYPGECLGLIGESGSGKSTTVNMITRLLDATGGSIVLDGEDITNVSGGELCKVYRKMQMVFQTPTDSFDPRCTLGDGIGESLRNSGMSRAETKKEVAKLLTDCGLAPEFAWRYPHQVSGGQCQRAAIARALAIRPKLLICDEATSALDVTIQQEILALLNDLRSRHGEGLSILFICHDIALVQQFCDRVLVMYRGRIVEQGIPDAIIRTGLTGPRASSSSGCGSMRARRRTGGLRSFRNTCRRVGPCASWTWAPARAFSPVSSPQRDTRRPAST